MPNDVTREITCPDCGSVRRIITGIRPERYVAARQEGRGRCNSCAQKERRAREKGRNRQMVTGYAYDVTGLHHLSKGGHRL